MASDNVCMLRCVGGCLCTDTGEKKRRKKCKGLILVAVGKPNLRRWQTKHYPHFCGFFKLFSFYPFFWGERIIFLVKEVVVPIKVLMHSIKLHLEGTSSKFTPCVFLVFFQIHRDFLIVRSRIGGIL